MRYGRKLSAVTKKEIDLWIGSVEEEPFVAGLLAKLKLTWHHQDVSVLLPIVGPVPAGAVADRETRRLLANLLILPLVLVHLGYGILYAFLLQAH